MIIIAQLSEQLKKGKRENRKRNKILLFLLFFFFFFHDGNGDEKKIPNGTCWRFFFRRRRLFIFSRRYFITRQFPNGAAGAGFSSRVFFFLSLSPSPLQKSSLTFLSQQFTVDRERRNPKKGKKKRQMKRLNENIRIGECSSYTIIRR